MALDFPAAVGFEVVPAADVGGEVDADAAAAFAVWGDVFDVGGGGCAGSGGGVGGVPVAHGDELGQPCRRRVGAGGGVELVGGERVAEQVPDRLRRCRDRGEQLRVGAAVLDRLPQVGGEDDAEHDRGVELGGLGARQPPGARSEVDQVPGVGV